jgi:hypothetical protein
LDRAEQVRQILDTRGLTLYRLSQQSAEIFGRASPFYVPHNLYCDVADSHLIPTTHQMLALSHFTNYRLYDWLAVFGCNLDDMARLQLLTRRQRTTLLDSSIYDVHAWIPWFADRPYTGHAPPIAPVGQFLASATPRRAAELLALNTRRFLYAQIGEADALAFPRLAPGSIVRIDERRCGELLSEGRNTSRPRHFLVEHGSGYTCSQLLVLEKDRIMLHSPARPCAQFELKLGKEARILGVVDAEIRPMGRNHDDGMLPRSVALPQPRPLNTQSSVKDLLKTSRLRAGVSFREASAMSRRIASTLSDQRYFAAPSTLSDYETLSAPPRHIQKIITLCILYGVNFAGFLRAAGLPLDRAGREPIPDELLSRQACSGNHGLHVAREKEGFQKPSGFLGTLVQQWEEVPLFLRHALNEITGLKSFSLSDVFWVGGDRAPSHPLLSNAKFVVVNRRVKSPARSRTSCEPPLCLLLKRDGSYLCGCCSLHQGNLDFRAYAGVAYSTFHFRNDVDAEVVGQVTAILSRFL